MAAAPLVRNDPQLGPSVVGVHPPPRRVQVVARGHRNGTSFVSVFWDVSRRLWSMDGDPGEARRIRGSESEESLDCATEAMERAMGLWQVTLSCDDDQGRLDAGLRANAAGATSPSGSCDVKPGDMHAAGLND